MADMGEQVEALLKATESSLQKWANAILAPEDQKTLDERIKQMQAEGESAEAISDATLLLKKNLVKQRIMNHEKGEKTKKDTQLSLFPAEAIPKCKHSATGPLQNDIARSNLFQAVKLGAKRLDYKDYTLSGPANTFMIYTGPQLSITDDALVYINGLRHAANAKANDKIYINRGAFLREIGWKTKHFGKKDFSWLDNSFDRLSKAHLHIRIGSAIIKTKQEYIKTHLLGSLHYDPNQDAYGFSIPEDTLYLFRENYFSYINIDLLTRHKNSAITSWLILYASSHENGEHRRRLNSLLEWSGLKTRPNDFYKLMGNAIANLIGEQFFLEGSIEPAKPISQSMVTWNKQTKFI